MPQHATYFPLDTAIRQPAKLSTLSPAHRHLLIMQARTWQDGEKLRKGSFIPSTMTRLKHSVIKIKGEVYALHRDALSGGAQGKIKILERLSDGVFFVDKILLESKFLHEALDEAEVLADRGLLYGFTLRVAPSDEGLFDYQVKSHTVMPFLGPDLHAHFKLQEKNNQHLSDELRFRLAIELVWDVARCHLGLSFISGCGRAHRDLKFANVILNDDGISLVDFGLSDNNPYSLKYGDKGTVPYFVVPSGRRISRQDKRSGEFFDMEAVRRMLCSVLCENPPKNHAAKRKADALYHKPGILTSEQVIKHKLYDYLEQGYNTEEERYAREDELLVHDAVTLAALLIGSQMHMSEENKGRLLSNKVLTFSVVGAYFSNQARWLEEGHAILEHVLGLSVEDVTRRAKFMRFGLAHDLERALEHPELGPLLDSGASNAMKRAAVCLFQRGLFNAQAESCLKAHPDTPMHCIKAAYYHDDAFLQRIAAGGEVVDKSPYGARPEEDDVLAPFPVLRTCDVRIMNQYQEALHWLKEQLKRRTKKHSVAVEKLHDGAILHKFLVHAMYRKAVLKAYQCSVQGVADDATYLCKGLLGESGMEAARAVSLCEQEDIARLVRVAKRITLQGLGELIKKHPKLTLHAWVEALDEAQDARFLLRALLRVRKPMQGTMLQRMVQFQSKNTELFALWAEDKCQSEVDNYLLSCGPFAPYLFEEGNEAHKLWIIRLYCITHTKAQAPHDLQDEMFFKACVVLSRVNKLKAMHIQLLADDAQLCEIIAREDASVLDMDIDYQAFRPMLHASLEVFKISKCYKLNLKGLQLNDALLKKCMSETTVIVSCPNKKQQALEAFVDLFQALYSMRQVFNMQNNITHESQKFHNMLDKLEQHVVISESSEFLDKLDDALTWLEDYSTDKVSLSVLEHVRVRQPKVESGPCGFFSCANTRDKKLSCYLYDVTQAVYKLEESLGFLDDVERKSVGSVSPQHGNRVHIDG